MGSILKDKKAFLVLVAALAPFVKSLGFELIWDDLVLLEQIRSVVEEGGVLGLLTRQFGDGSGFYRPVVLLSMWFDTVLFDTGPWLPHLVNLLLHAACALLVYEIMKHLFGDGEGALAGALVFAVHPVHLENVVWVSGRTDLWAALFGLAVFLFYVRSRSEEGGESNRLYWAGQVFFVLGLLSKELVLMVVPALVAWEFLVARESGGPVKDLRRHALRWGGGFAIGFALVLMLRFGIVGVGLASGSALGEASGPGGSAPPWRMLVAYLRLLVYPEPLQLYYTASDLRVGLNAVVGLAGFVLVALAAARADFKKALFGLIWFSLFVFPVLEIVLKIAGAPVSERYLYLPSIVVSVLVACLFGIKKIRGPLKYVAIVLVVFMGAVSFARSSVWDNQRGFYEYMVNTSKAAMGHLKLGDINVQEGKLDEALVNYSNAYTIDPYFTTPLTNAAVIYSEKGNSAKAIELLSRAYGVNSNVFSVVYNLAYEYARIGNSRKAVELFEKSIALNPKSYKAFNNMGVNYKSLGQYSKAEESFKKALQLNRNYRKAYENLQNLMAMTGRRGEAERFLRSLPVR